MKGLTQKLLVPSNGEERFRGKAESNTGNEPRVFNIGGKEFVQKYLRQTAGSQGLA